MAFADSENKQTLRLEWDLPLLKAWSLAAKRRLTYFGLPGPGMLDLLAWKEVLDARRTAVEERPKAVEKRDLADDAAAQLVANALQAGLLTACRFFGARSEWYLSKVSTTSQCGH
jgi:hypothetical protein